MGPVMVHDQIGELPDPYLMFQRMPQRPRPHHQIPIPPTHPLLHHIPRLLQVAHNPLSSSLRNSHPLSNIPQPHLRITCQTHQDVPMIRQERPPVILHQSYVTGKQLPV